MPFLVFDFETTGLQAGLHEPIQLAAVLLDDNLTELGAFESLIRPLRPDLASPEAMAVNGRDLDELAKEAPPDEVMARFLAFILLAGELVVMVGHNVGFDLQFLAEEERRHGFIVPRKTAAVDTCELARVHLEARGLITDSKLGTVAAHYAIAFKAHDALGDVRACAGILTQIRGEAPDLLARALEGRLLGGLLADATAAQPGSAFVLSLKNHYEAKGWLSPKQITALVRIAEMRS